MKKIPFILNHKEKPTIAIIGFGRFGKLLTQIFLKWSNANILLVSRKKQQQTHQRLSFVNLQNIHSADIIIPCVPISAFEETIQKIALVAKNSAIVMDVCSVKVVPTRLMKSFLPDSIQKIATHPMFGPDSFRINKGLKGLRLVMHNISASSQNYKTIKSFFKKLRISVIEITPHKHDRWMAMSLGYSYLVGKIGQQMHITKTPIDTHDFDLLVKHARIISNDSETLFFDMQTCNPFAGEVHRKFLLTTQKILSEIKAHSVDNRRTRV